MKSIPSPGLAAGAAPQVGQIVGERYRLEEWLESGGMGSVWRARQVRLRSPAAIKFLDPSLIEVPEMLDRFLQEARSAAAVQSAHVIQVFDFGSAGGIPYIAMEFLEGENLASRLLWRGALTPDELGKIFGEVARGLGQAHALGVVHRDVKPANIFLAREGKHEVTKLIDFGIAKVREDALRVSQIIGTEIGTVLGTPQYMSPEQLRGWNTLDHRTDLWSLGVIACECLTGRCPFPGTTLGDLTVQICTEEPLAPSSLGDVPAGFDEWFFRATRKDPAERFDSAGEMADALAAVLVPVSVRKRARGFSWSAPPLQGAWALAARRARRLSRLARAHAEEAASGAALLLRSVRVSSRSIPLPASAWRWIGIASASLALLAVLGSYWQGIKARGVPVAPVAQEAHAALPGSSQPLSGGGSRAPARGQPATVAPPVVTLADLPVAPLAEAEAGPRPSPPARASEGQRRSQKSGSPAARASRDEATPSSPMSEAMVRIGALIARGGEKKAPPVRPPDARAMRKAEPKPK